MDLGGLRRAHIEDRIQRGHVGYVHERLARVHRCAEHGGHSCDDARQRGSQGGELLRAARGDRGDLCLRQIRRGLVAVLLRQDSRLHQSHRPGVGARRARERGLRAARRRIERRPLELDQGVPFRHPLAGGDEDARDPRGPRRRELREMRGARGHGADGGDDLREGL